MTMNSPGRGGSGVVVLCPMAIERKAIAAAVSRARSAGGLGEVRVVQTGIGREAVLRVLEAEVGSGRAAAVILAGACGALEEVEDVPPVARVIDEHGHEWRPRLAVGGAGDDSGGRGATLIGVDRIISTPEEKRALARATGAQIVDMEAHAFARVCEARGLAWGVVRGVSDTPDEMLPTEVLGWVTPGGDTRAGRAAWDMLRRPSLVGHIAAVMRRSSRVLPRVGEAVVEMARRAEAGANAGPARCAAGAAP